MKKQKRTKVLQKCEIHKYFLQIVAKMALYLAKMALPFVV